jgi:hypothetical protein
MRFQIVKDEPGYIEVKPILGKWDRVRFFILAVIHFLYSQNNYYTNLAFSDFLKEYSI